MVASHCSEKWKDSSRSWAPADETSSVIVNVLPADVDVDKVTYTYKSPQEFVVSDGGRWHLDLSHL